MKRISLILLAILLCSFSCSTEEQPEPCHCTITAKRYISPDAGETWFYNATDSRTGMQFPCDYHNRETNQSYEGNFWYKTVWTCNNQ
jgi:hypothetical protein